MKSKTDKAGLVFLFAMLIMVLISGDSPGFRTALLGFFGIVLEALPFMVVGSLIGGFIEVYLPDGVLAKLRGARLRSVLLAALAGLIFPVCECAVIPVLYRLLKKGLPPEAGLAYLFAGPVVNPIVFLSTLTAYRFDVLVPIVRTVAGYSCAVTAALVVSAILKGKITRDFQAESAGHAHGGGTRDPKFVQAAVNAAEDLFNVGRYFIMGAAIASIFQSFIARETLLRLSSTPLLAIIGMMLISFLLSICSDGDAFVAASFGKSFFPFSSQIAFMIMGPLLDLKLLMMYRMVFPRKTVLTIVPTITVMVFLHALAVQLVMEAL